MNKKGAMGAAKISVTLFAIAILGVFIFQFVLPVFAATERGPVSFQGDIGYSATLNYYFVLFNAEQDSPCDGIPDFGEIKLAEDTSAVDDLDVLDDDDYYLFNNSVEHGSTVYMYVCDGVVGNIVLKYVKIVSVNDTYSVDIARVEGSSLHPDLTNQYIFICDELGGTQLNTETAKADFINNEYIQYYPIDYGTGSAPGSLPINTGAVVEDLFVLLDDDQSSPCDLDSTKMTGKRITISPNSGDNYGVHVTFSPDETSRGWHAIGDLHDDFDGKWLEVFDDNGLSRGISFIQDGDCNDDGDDDYSTTAHSSKLYYDNPTSGEISMALYPGVLPDNYIAGLPNKFSSQDAVIKIYGAVPLDITSMMIVDGGKVYSTYPDGSGNYALYLPDSDGINSNPVTVQFMIGAVSVFDKVLIIPNTIDNSCSGDILLNIGKVTGEAHSDLETGDDTLQVFNDSVCSSPVSLTVIPSDMYCCVSGCY